MRTLWVVLLSLMLSSTFLGCGPGERASTDPADEMPPEEDLTEDPVEDDLQP